MSDNLDDVGVIPPTDEFVKSISSLKKEIADLYVSDEIPWVVGYSGGKDSTATLQLLWSALLELDATKRKKPVYVITTDTLVENPIVSAWVNNSLKQMQLVADEQGLPITAHRLTPDITDTFWVNLIGRGYPAPRPRFRWCTERLKIDPTSQFITDIVRQNGEAIVVLGTRKAESSSRARVMKRLEKKRVRENLNPHTTLTNAYVYPPIQNWSNDDVWLYLMQVPNPWGHDNKNLLTLYQGASADGECPLVIDTTTPSCGSSRFGCWVCTLVAKDKSMQAMILNDQSKEWMLPLLEFRNELDIADDRHLRDFRRMNGHVYLFNNKPVPGPYTQKSRQMWLKKLLEVQSFVQQEIPPDMGELELISVAELREIRRIWVLEKHEIEDVLPQVYEKATGQPFPDELLDETLIFNDADLSILSDVSEGNEIQYQLLRELISVERQFSSMSRRAGIYEALEKALKRNFYKDKNDAIDRATKLQASLEEGRNRAEAAQDL